MHDENGVLLAKTNEKEREFSVSQSLADSILSDLEEYRRDLYMEEPKFYAGTLSVVPEKRFLLANILAGPFTHFNL